jgi:hypothetical protein
MVFWGLLSPVWMRRKITKQLPNTKSEGLRWRFGQLSQVPLYVLFKEGAGSRARTDDLLITNQLLYQLSYTGECR